MSPLRRYWPILALIAGLMLCIFEYRQAGGITADNAFWLFVGALVALIAVIDLVQSLGKREGDAGDPPGPLD